MAISALGSGVAPHPGAGRLVPAAQLRPRRRAPSARARPARRRSTVGSLATARPGWSLASSVSRAASFTGSPITVYSSRLAAPT